MYSSFAFMQLEQGFMLFEERVRFNFGCARRTQVAPNVFADSSVL